MFNMKLMLDNDVYEYSIDNEPREYDSSLDDGRSVIADICEVCFESKKIEFQVSGFGQELWPVDCLYDLTCIVEQLPEALESISSKEKFTLNFYEQGMERIVSFDYNEDFYILTCTSRTDWQPNPKTIIAQECDIREILEQLKKDFYKYTNIMCPF